MKLKRTDKCESENEKRIVMKHDLGKIVLRNFIGVLLSLTVGAIAFYLIGYEFQWRNCYGKT